MRPMRLPGWILMAAVAAVAVARASADDWPCYQMDPARSAVAAGEIAFPLVSVWRYQPQQAPAPAWPEPGRELHRLDFDYAFQPVVVGDTVFFGSSADDTLRAVSLFDGRLRWRYVTGGPIRFAPAVDAGRVYVASDDGFLYCLDADSGRLLWKVRGGPDGRKLLGNGRMISRWPCRSGVLVLHGTVYFSAGMWPSEGIYVYALDAGTGRQLWCNDSSGDMYRNQPHGGASAFTGVCPQGYMLASDDLLLIPSGRTTPAAYDRRTGRLVYYQPYLYAKPYNPEGWANRANGGCWALLAGDLFFSPMHRGGAPDLEAVIGESDPRSGDGLVAYSLQTGLRVIDLEGKHRAIVRDGVLYAVGDGETVAVDLAGWREMGRLHQDNVRWSKPHGRVYSMALAGDALLVGGDGTITAFRASSGEDLWKQAVDAQVRGIAVVDARVVIATDRGTIECFQSGRIAVPPIVVAEPSTWQLPVPEESTRIAAESIRRSGVTGGYALVLGERDASLAAALALQTDLHVISALDPSCDVAAERERLLSTGLSGSRVAIETLDPSSPLPFPPYFADLVVVSRNLEAVPPRDLCRILRPAGGVLCLPGAGRRAVRRLAREARIPPAELRTSEGWTLVDRGTLPGAGEWRYQWADGGKTGIGEQRGVAPPFEILWFGGPGPDRMMPRHWGTSPPLSVAGRVFVTGHRHVIAFDPYNGRELWSSELPGAGRAFVEERSANFVADDDSLYVAAGPSCHRLLQSTGKTLTVYTVPELPAEETGQPPSSPPEVDLEWPATWHVLGPLPRETPPLAGERLRGIPDELAVGEKVYAATPCRPVNGMIDFTYLFGGYGFAPLGPGEEPGPYPRGKYREDQESFERIAYAFARITCPAPGRLTIGAGADWWMQWFLDGEPIYDTLESGNRYGTYAADNHVFSTPVSEGEHVLAVMVKAGSMGWCLVSAGGSAYVSHLAPAPDRTRRMTWGYLSVTEDLVLGTALPSRFDERYGESAALFALSRKDRGLRWTYLARRSVPNTAVAFGDGRMFLLDATSRWRAEAAKRAGNEPVLEQTLLALDLASGKELWRQDDVPPSRYDLQYAAGVVLLAGNTAYDAKTGDKLWEADITPERLPLVRGDWIIAQPAAYNLRTGEPRMARDILTGEERPWKFARAYGCGGIAGCRDILFFRSGTVGFFDFERDGTTTFGGVRPGCSINMIAAAGLMILPESSAGCSCSYNFQTSLALVPDRDGDDPWYVFQGEKPAAPVAALRLNFGAPGDRRDTSGAPWLGFPRPTMDGACPAPLKVSGEKLEWYYRPLAHEEPQPPDPGWICASGLRGAVSCEAELNLPQDAAARPYTVRMHFAEPDGARPGERVFDIRIQDRLVLAGFDVANEAAAGGAPVVKEWKGIPAGAGLRFQLVPASAAQPVLSGVEIIAETVP